MQPTSWALPQLRPSLGLASRARWCGAPDSSGTCGVHSVHWPVLLSVPGSTFKGRACQPSTFPPLSWIFIAIKEKTQGGRRASGDVLSRELPLDSVEKQSCWNGWDRGSWRGKEGLSVENLDLESHSHLPSSAGSFWNKVFRLSNFTWL